MIAVMTQSQANLLDQMARDAPLCAPAGTTSVGADQWHDLDALVDIGLAIADEYQPMFIAKGYKVRWARLLVVMHPLPQYRRRCQR